MLSCLLTARCFSVLSSRRLFSSKRVLSSVSTSNKEVENARLELNVKPETPISFGQEFHIEPYTQPLPLSIINVHELDEKITFDEDAHEYFVHGEKMQFSVTQIVESFFEKFDPDEAIIKMKRSARWPRPEYMMKNGTIWTDAQIKQYWDGVGQYARNRGTWMHYNIERYLNNLIPSEDLPEMRMFYAFYDEVIAPRKIIPWRTEWRIHAPEHNLAGSVDFVGRAPDGTYVLMDWKRSKNLSTNMDSAYGRRGKAPLEHVDDCDGSKYTLQLNIYRYILQKHYNIKVSKMYLASFHPTANAYFSAEVPIWENEVKAVLEQVDGQAQAMRHSNSVFDAITPPSVSTSSSPTQTMVPKKGGSAKKPVLVDMKNPFH